MIYLFKKVYNCETGKTVEIECTQEEIEARNELSNRIVPKTELEILQETVYDLLKASVKEV